MSAFRYGWNKNSPKPGAFWAGFERCKRKPLEWKEELNAAARAIASTAGKPLWLCFSGGMDSEVMCRIFFDQGIQFSALTLEHTEGTNANDVKRARDWCWNRGVPHKIERMSLDKFLDHDINAYLKDGFVTDAIGKYHQLKVLEIAHQQGGCVVLGSGVLIPRVSDEVDEPSERDIFLRFNAGHTIMPEWCKQNGAEHIPSFFSSTPEVCLSYFSVPALSLAVDSPEMLKSTAGAFIIKLMAYQTAWPDIKPRYTDFGFKHRRNQMRAVRQRIRMEYKDVLQTHDVSYPELLSQLSPT